jgi:hypothetical protein
MGDLTGRGGSEFVKMPSAKRLWIAVAALAALTAAGLVYLHFASRRASRLIAEPGAMVYPASPQQAEHALGVLAELPPDAPAIGYIDVESLRKLQSSPLSTLLGLGGSKSREDREYQQFVRETGFDYTRDLDEGAIAFWPENTGEPGEGASAENRAFIIADGRFDERKIRAYALKSGKAHASGAQTIYEIPGAPPVSFEFLSPGRIAITSGTASAEFLARARPASPDPGLKAGIDRLAGAPIFAIARADRMPKSFYTGLSKSPQVESLAHDVVALTLAAQPQGNVLKVVVDGESTSVENALTIATFLEFSRMGASLALSNPKTSRQLTEEQGAFLEGLLRESRISRRDRWVRLTFDITPQMLGADDREPAAQKKNKDLR